MVPIFSGSNNFSDALFLLNGIPDRLCSKRRGGQIQKGRCYASLAKGHDTLGWGVDIPSLAHSVKALDMIHIEQLQVTTTLQH